MAPDALPHRKEETHLSALEFKPGVIRISTELRDKPEQWKKYLYHKKPPKN